MIKTNLFGKSNAVLLADEGEFVAIISCSGGNGFDITHKVEKAIKEHFAAERVRITSKPQVMTNQEEISFEADLAEDGDEFNAIRNFTLKIVVTY